MKRGITLFSGNVRIGEKERWNVVFCLLLLVRMELEEMKWGERERE